MALKDLIKNLQKTFKKQDVSTYGKVEVGKVGTPLFSGILNVEFNPELAFPESLKVYNTMRKGDATVEAILAAINNPILSAKHFIKPGGKSKQDERLAEFANEALFKRIKYKTFLGEALNYLPVGFYYFEKIFKIDENGFIWWDRFSPRVPSAHYLWSMQSNPKWIDGHPSGVTQQLPGQTDDTKTENTQPEIPWNKLILFTNKQEGNNFEGVSLLRPAYKHWFYKDLLYKIQGISAERFGCGIPVAKHPAGIGKEVEDKLDEMLENIRTNEQAYIRTQNNIELDILIPKGDPKSATIDKAIKHHDRKIYDSILAGFLNLTTGEGGSNALSKDQSSFFLRGLQGIANYIQDIINPQIKELIDMNFQNVEHYPTLEITEIGQTSLDETINAISTAKEKGLVTLTIEDEMMVREILRLPSRTMKEIKKDKEEKKEEEPKEIPIEKPEKEPEETPEEEEKRKQAEQKKKPTIREIAFTRNITEYEQFLDGEYNNVYLPILEKAEEKYRQVLTAVYEGADTERIDGVVVFAKTTKNAQLKNKAIKAVNAITKQLNDKFINSPLQRKLFGQTFNMAVANLEINEKLLQEIKINQGQFDSFLAGYISNMNGILFNEPRRIKEDIILNFGSQVSVDLAIEQAGQVVFNRNVFKLSTVTHARAAYINLITEASTTQGFTHFKVLVPRNKIKDISPTGLTAAVLFGIFTVAQFNKRISEASDGKNAAAVGGLGLHHGAFIYFYFIESERLEEEREIAKQQRKEFAKLNK